MAGNAAAVTAQPVKQEQQQADVSMADAEGPDTGQGVKAEPAEAAAAMEEDEVDPLDAFMAAEVRLPATAVPIHHSCTLYGLWSPGSAVRYQAPTAQGSKPGSSSVRAVTTLTMTCSVLLLTWYFHRAWGCRLSRHSKRRCIASIAQWSVCCFVFGSISLAPLLTTPHGAGVVTGDARGAEGALVTASCSSASSRT